MAMSSIFVLTKFRALFQWAIRLGLLHRQISLRGEAVSCSNTRDYTQNSFSLPDCFAGESFPGLSQLMPSHNPDMVLLQLGVNDVWGGEYPGASGTR